MSDSDDLTTHLGAAPPPGVAALAAADRQALADVIAGARRTQSADLAASFEATLRHIPFPLRGVVKKVLLG